MIKIKNLNKKIGDTVILKNIDMELNRGSIFSLIGPNGSGKTTLIKCLIGLVFPEPGSYIGLDGEDIPIDKFGKYAGYMPQIPRYPAGLSVSEFLDMVTGLEGTSSPYRDELIRIYEVDKFIDKPLGKLSGGMRQKVNILQCFMFPKKFYIVDEPTASLDPFVANTFKQMLLKKRNEGACILFSSHILSEVRELADRVALIIDGEILVENSMQEVLSEESSGELQRLFQGGRLKKNEEQKG